MFDVACLWGSRTPALTCSIGSFVGLVPSEHPSGASRMQGSITKTSNTHACRLLVEAAWHHRAGHQQDHARAVGTGGNWPRRQPGPAATWVTGDYTPAGSTSTCDTYARSSPTSPSPANSPAGAGRWPSWTEPPRSRFVPAVLAAARAATRDAAISSRSPGWRRSTLDTRPAPAEQPVLR